MGYGMVGRAQDGDRWRLGIWVEMLELPRGGMRAEGGFAE
jgi:hypothetical protein